jgi:hypothetical protein
MTGWEYVGLFLSLYMIAAVGIWIMTRFAVFVSSRTER